MQTLQQKRHIPKKSSFVSSQDEAPMSAPADITLFKELTEEALTEEHQVQIFKMMMPENIELRIKDMTTL